MWVKEKNNIVDNFNKEKAFEESRINFKGIIADIKEDDINPAETKKYIAVIQRILDTAYKNCDGEVSREEILQEFLEDYRESLKFRGNADIIYSEMLKYRGYKELLKLYKNKRGEFNSVLKNARQEESKNNDEVLGANIYKDKNIVTILRILIRLGLTDVEKQMLPYISDEKNAIEIDMKKQMIRIIHESVSFLNDYGILDEYINQSNNELNELGLKRLSFKKRNPIADEQYDESGKRVENVEDIGVVDSLRTEILEELPIEDLLIMTAFWESKYFQNRIKILKAMTTIDTLDFWQHILTRGEIAINDIKDEIIVAILKKDLALNHLYNEEIEITPHMREQYQNFIKNNGIYKDGETIERELRKMEPELENLLFTEVDMTALSTLIIGQLFDKNPRVKNWGTIENQEKIKFETIEFLYDSSLIGIAIEHRNFRSPLIISVSEDVLKDLYKVDAIYLPKYKNSGLIDKKYNNTMNRVCIPVNEYFRKVIKEEYKANPYSALLASLNGKPVKKMPGQPGGDER